MVLLDRIPDQIGYLVLTDDFAVISSGGELENDEKNANIISGLISMTESVDPGVFPKNSCKRITITYEEFCYIICMSNKKIYIVKKKHPPRAATEGNPTESNLINI